MLVWVNQEESQDPLMISPIKSTSVDGADGLKQLCVPNWTVANSEIVRNKTSGAGGGGLRRLFVSSCAAAMIGIIPLCILMLSISDRHTHTLFCVWRGRGLFANSLHTRLQPVVLMSGWVRAVEKLWLLIHLEILFIFSVPFLSNPSPKCREQPWVVFLEGFRAFKLSLSSLSSLK